MRCPEIRSEAANAIGQAAQGWKARQAAPAAAALDAAFAPLAARLKVEAEPDVRAAICETIGRLPYATAAQASGGADAARDGGPRRDADRSARRRARVSKRWCACSASCRSPVRRSARRCCAGWRCPLTGRSRHRRARAPPRARGADDGRGGRRGDAGRAPRTIPMRRCAGWRCARRRPRRRRSAPAELHSVLTAGRADDRRWCGSRRCAACARATTPTSCAAAIGGDRRSRHARRAVRARSARRLRRRRPTRSRRSSARCTICRTPASPRGWHRAAHALVALAAAAPERGAAALPQFTGSRIWQLRMYAARAAAELEGSRGARTAGARRGRQRRARRRSRGCASWPATRPTPIYVAQLSRNGYQVLRAAALALDGTPHPDSAVPALKAALAAAGRRRARQLARRARRDRQDADRPRRPAEDRFAAAGRRRTISTPRICAGSRRRARASRSAASAPSSSRCSPRRRRPRCSASRTSPSPATTTA